jgi:prepilin-type N-terminal cleavage/methylation domain-containing protein
MVRRTSCANAGEMTQRTHRLRGEAGFNLIEMTVVLGIMGVLAGVTIFQVGQSRPVAIGDSAMRVVLSQLNAARERAITERRNMRVTFTSAGVTVIREEIPTGTSTLSVVPFEGAAQFLVINGVGDIPSPDAIGYSSAVYFPTATGSPPEIKFSSEGTFIDQDGMPANGTVFIAVPNQRISARAISIFGSTGRIRAYKFNGRDWKPA